MNDVNIGYSGLGYYSFKKKLFCEEENNIIKKISTKDLIILGPNNRTITLNDGYICYANYK